MSKQLDWDAYRYVLEDPGLDRLAFEARMLDDTDLALAVAEAMSHIDAIRAASFIATPIASGSSSSSTARASQAPLGLWRLSSLAALAASLLLAIGWLNYRIVNTPSNTSSGQQIARQNLAESWLAIRQAELIDGSGNLVDVSTNFESARDEDSLPGADSEDDWLMDAAREFYAQGEAG